MTATKTFRETPQRRGTNIRPLPDEDQLIEDSGLVSKTRGGFQPR